MDDGTRSRRTLITLNRSGQRKETVMKKLSIGLVSILSLTSFLAGFGAGTIARKANHSTRARRFVSSSARRPAGFMTAGLASCPEHMVKHIPGQPEIIVQIMAGAGSVIAANHVYKVAKPDGLTLGMPLNGIYVDQFVGRAEAQYDLRKFHFIGSPAVESNIFYMRADAPYKSIADVIKAKEAPKCGSTGTASTDYILSKILEDTVGAKFNSVLGYAGGTEIDIAVEKGEVICRAHSLSAHFGREPFDSWHKRNFDRHLVQTARKRDSNAADTPTLNEVFEQYKVPANSRRCRADSIWRREILAVRSW